MTILPIVDRELRVASRRAFTYRMRWWVGSSAMIVGGAVLLGNLGKAPFQMGQTCFQALAILALIHCLLSGRFATADCLSEEKREGTLGLLFLTDLKGYDVVLGKLVATSLNAFYGLLAILPVMAVPLLMGGVSNAQFWSMVLVLMNTFFFSLAVGMFSSSVSRDARRTMGLNFGLLFLFTLLLPGVAGVIASNSATHAFPRWMLFSSPLYAGFLCLFAPLLPTTVAPPVSDFWMTVGVIHGLTWLLLIVAAWIAPRSWQDRPSPPPRSWRIRIRDFLYAWSYGKPEKRPAFRRRLLDVNAYYWLAARAKLKPIHVWVAFGLLAVWWVWGRITTGRVWLDETTEITLAVMINVLLKLWVVLEAAQRLAEAQKIGSLELVLSTPLSERDVIKGQFLALRRQFGLPLLLALAIEPVLMTLAVRSAPHPEPEMVGWWWASMFFLPVDLVALTFVAMARSLTAKNFNQAIVSTVGLVLVLPWIAFGLVSLLTRLWFELTSNGGDFPGWQYYLHWWFWLSLAADVGFAWAAILVLQRMRDIAMKRYDTPQTARVESSRERRARKQKSAATVVPQVQSANVRRGPRKIALSFAVVLLVLVCSLGFFMRHSRPKLPPPVVVPLALNKGMPQIFAAGEGIFFLLSDGSLWRWGAAGNFNAPAELPQRIGTNNHWKNIWPTGNGFLAIRNDGTLWSADGDFNVRQMNDDKDWLTLSTQYGRWCTVAIKTNGTLWGLGNLSRLTGKSWTRVDTNFIALETNGNWEKVQLSGGGLLGIKRDGTLWAWGSVFMYGSGGYSQRNLPQPVQVCSESNWVDFAPGWGSLARSRDGRLWMPLQTPPNAELPAKVVCKQILTKAVSGHYAVAYCGKMMGFELRADGTIWELPLDYPMVSPKAGGPPEKWRQFGTRNDWIALWPGYNTAFGLTADGTIWTWGIDPSRKIDPDFFTRLKTLQLRVKFLVSGQNAATVSPMSLNIPQSNNEPRPLMQLKGDEK